MAYSYVKYTADGTTQVFNVPFNYIDKRHVSVSFGDVVVSFSWTSNYQVRTTTVPDADVVVTIRRSTPSNEPLVDFTDSAVITERDLDIIALQSVYLTQETIDLYEEMSGDLSGVAETLMARAAQAIQTANQAFSVASAAAALAQDCADQLDDVEGTVVTKSEEAVNAATLATTKAAEALASAGDASSSASSASASASSASSSASSAAASAAAAALAADFDPSLYYTKAETNAEISSRSVEMSQVTGLSASLMSKSDTGHTHSIGDVANLQARLDAKLGTSDTAAAAAKLATSRAINLTGGVSGTASFNGTADVSISTTVSPSHAHDAFSQVRMALADASVNVIGSIAFLYNTTGVSKAPGDTINGSSCRFGSTAGASASTPDGVWRVLGAMPGNSGTLCVRIS